MNQDPVHARIAGQFNFAKSKFNNLLQVGPFEFTVVFPEIDSQVYYNITLPPNYPESPPTLMHDTLRITTALTSNWISVFQLVHVVQQLNCYAKNRPSARKDVRNEANVIRSAIVSHGDKITKNESERQKIVQNLPMVVDAQKRLKNLENEVKAKKTESDAILEKTFDGAEKLRHLDEKRKTLTSQINAAKASGPQKLVEARHIKASQLRQEAISVDSQVEQLKKRLANKDINLKQFVKELGSLKEKQKFNKLLAEEIEK